MQHTLANAGRRVLAWIIVVAVALLALRLIVGIAIGFVTFLATIVIVAVAAVALVWAVRRL
jgi:hypothetical protein